MTGERGFTLIELLVSIASFVVVLSAILMMTTVATHNQDRIAKRVAASQRGRPVMTRLIDELRSGCVAQRVAPVLAGSTNTSISFISKSGSSVTPTPDKRVVTLTGTTLSEAVHPPLPGGAFPWDSSDFSTTPSSNMPLLTNVSAPSGVMFRYFDYVNGALNPTPLSTSPSGLTSTNAARTAYVNVTLTAAPSTGASTLDPTSPITLSDSADLRLESASQDTTQENLPCM